MPLQSTPKDREEYELWRSAVTADSRKSVDGVTVKKKCSLKAQFSVCVATGKLVDKETQKEVVVQSEMDAHLQVHHDNVDHPGRDCVYQSLLRLYSGVSWTAVSEYIKNCEVCRSVPKRA